MRGMFKKTRAFYTVRADSGVWKVVNVKQRNNTLGISDLDQVLQRHQP